MTLYEYGKGKGMTNEEARIFSKIMREHPRVKGHGLYAEKSNDYSDPYLNEWVGRCNHGMYGAFWSGDNHVHKIMVKVMGAKKYWKMANAFRKQSGGWEDEKEWMARAGY